MRSWFGEFFGGLGAEVFELDVKVLGALEEF